MLSDSIKAAVKFKLSKTAAGIFAPSKPMSAGEYTSPAGQARLLTQPYGYTAMPQMIDAPTDEQLIRTGKGLAKGVGGLAALGTAVAAPATIPYMAGTGMSVLSGRAGEHVQNIASGNPRQVLQGVAGAASDLYPAGKANILFGVGEGALANNLATAVAPITGYLGAKGLGRFAGKYLPRSQGASNLAGDVAGNAASDISLSGKQVFPTNRPAQTGVDQQAPAPQQAPKGIMRGPIEASLMASAPRA